MILPPSLQSIYLAVSKWAVVALVGIALAVSGYAFGRHVAAGEAAQEKYDIAVAYAKVIIDRQKTAQTLSEKLAAIRAAQGQKDKVIDQEINNYAHETPSANRCLLPGNFRLLHDAAATGTPAGTGSGDAQTADPVEDAAVLETIGENYKICRSNADIVAAWQRRYQALEQPDQ